MNFENKKEHLEQVAVRSANGTRQVTLPHFASRTSNCLKDGRPHTLARLQTLLGNAAVQRLVVHTPGAGLGARLAMADDDSQVELSAEATYWVGGRLAGTAPFFGDTQVSRIRVPANSSGILQIHLRAAFQIDNAPPFSNEDYVKDFFVNFDLTVSRRGELRIGDGVVTDRGVDRSLQLFVESIDASSAASYVQAVARVVTTSSQGRTAGAGYAVNQGVSGRAWTRQFRVEVIPPAVASESGVPETPSVTKTHRVFFETPRQATLTPQQQDQIISWYHGLSQTTRDRLAAGSERVRLIGRASTTGSTVQNLELANDRARAVQHVLSTYIGSQAQFATSAEGEYGAGTEDNIEALNERRVDIHVSDTVDRPGRPLPNSTGP